MLARVKNSEVVLFKWSLDISLCPVLAQSNLRKIVSLSVSLKKKNQTLDSNTSIYEHGYLKGRAVYEAVTQKERPGTDFLISLLTDCTNPSDFTLYVLAYSLEYKL